jgi:hypothetical protein
MACSSHGYKAEVPLVLHNVSTNVSSTLSVAKPWSPFSSNWKVELVDRVSAGSDRYSPISVSTANISDTELSIYIPKLATKYY